jgi:hypothetical protein
MWYSAKMSKGYPEVIQLPWLLVIYYPKPGPEKFRLSN